MVWRPYLQSDYSILKSKHLFSRGRTRTYGLRVMSPTSCQLLYPASINWNNITQNFRISQVEGENIPESFLKKFSPSCDKRSINSIRHGRQSRAIMNLLQICSELQSQDDSDSHPNQFLEDLQAPGYPTLLRKL